MVMLVSNVKQSDLVIHIHICIHIYAFSDYFPIYVYHKVLSVAPCAIHN